MAEKAAAAPLSPADQLAQVLTLLQEGKNEEADEILHTQKVLLHEACAQENIDAIKILLKKGVSCSEWNKLFLLPLHIAVNTNNNDVVKLLLNHDRHGVDRPTKFGETPLHFACMNGNLDMVQLLVKRDADLKCVDRVGNTALHYAVSSNNPKLVEWLLQHNDLRRFINKKNEFQHSPLHRAAILQCVEVIQILQAHKAKTNCTDKNGLTPADFAHYLYNNQRKGVPIIGPLTSSKISTASISIGNSSGYIHMRSRSESLNLPHNPYPIQSPPRASIALDGSTISLPGASAIKRRPSATQSRRPVNITFSSPHSYSRQVSCDSSTGSRSSIYLKDKDQATQLSRSLDRTSSYSVDELQRVVEDHTASEPPIDMEFIPTNEVFQLSRGRTHHHSKEHNVHIKLTDPYLEKLDRHDLVVGHLAAGMSWRPGYPQNYILVSPVCFISNTNQQLYEIRVSLPHALNFPEDVMNRITILSAPCISSTYSPDRRELTKLSGNIDPAIERSYITFTTIIKQPTVFAVGVSMARFQDDTIPYPTLKCCLYIACPADKDKYLLSVDIETYVGLDLKTVDQVMQKFVVPHGFIVEEKTFLLSGPVLKLTGFLENEISDWQMTRRGTGLFKYTQIALSTETEQVSTRSLSHRQSYPLKEAFFVECDNPTKTLKCRILATVDGKQVVNKLVTPYTPPPINATPAIAVSKSERDHSPSPESDIENSTDEGSHMRVTSV